MMLNIFILIPIYNGLSYTKECLKSLDTSIKKLDRSIAEFNVVVIDDASTDGSEIWISDNYPDVKILKGDGDLWWSGAINMGVDYAVHHCNADYVVWWNNDIVADNEYFANLVEILNSNDHNTIIGSKIYLAQKENIVWSMGGIFDPYTGEKNMIGRECPDNEKYMSIMECDWLPGMGTVIHKSVYDSIGYLDQRIFPQYHGDSDFTFKARINGYKILVYPALKIYNDTSNSGLKHNESFKMLIQSLFSIKSNFNIKKDFIFYIRYAKSAKAYGVLIKRYFAYIGGFFKWKILGLFGKSRDSKNNK